MHAIFQNGSKQYQVSLGEIISIEKLNNKIGNIIKFDKIMMIIDKKNTVIGHPFIEKAKIKAQIISHNKGPKIRIIKFHRRKHYRKSQGHRQWFTNIKIMKIYN